jgi:predicted nucleic acid-binding protein
MIVLDASAVIDLLLDRPLTGQRVARRVSAGESLVAPHLLDAEVGQVLRRFTLTGEISPQRAASALDDYALLPIVRYPHTPLLRRALALYANTTFYDALYLSLSEALDAPLITLDRALAGIPGARATVEVL